MASGSVPAGPYVTIAFDNSFERIRAQVPPNARPCRKLGRRPTERFDRQPTIIATLLQGGEQTTPWHMPAPWRAPVVLGDMDMCEVSKGKGDRLHRVALLDVGMESIEHAGDGGVADPVHVVDKLPHRIETMR